jgi:NAD-dependent deacetylase
MEQNVKELALLIQQAKSIVFFGGAGVSTESGIPDFRSSDGLYQSKWKDPPETVLSRRYFNQKPALFFEFYREKILFPSAMPNNAHLALAAMERAGKLQAVITQNIDGLHQKAGSLKVIELHGTTLSNHCMSCGNSYPLEYIINSHDVPSCSCGGIVKPDVVLYEEALDNTVIEEALAYISSCDLLLIGGTSLTVYPAAGFIRYAQGKIAVINRTPTPLDQTADLFIQGSVGETLDKAMSLLDLSGKN